MTTQMLDKSRPYAEVYGDSNIRYEQDGRTYDPAGRLIDDDADNVEEFLCPESGCRFKAATQDEIDAHVINIHGGAFEAQKIKDKLYDLFVNADEKELSYLQTKNNGTFYYDNGVLSFTVNVPALNSPNIELEPPADDLPDGIVEEEEKTKLGLPINPAELDREQILEWLDLLGIDHDKRLGEKRLRRLLEYNLEKAEEDEGAE